MPEIDSDAERELEYLHARAVTLRAEINQRTEELDAINARVRDMVSGTGAVELPGGGRLTLAPNRRFSARLFAERYPAQQYPELYALVPDRAAAEARLPPDEYAACSTHSTRRVTWA